MMTVLETPEIDSGRGCQPAKTNYRYIHFDGNAFECRALVCPEEEGGYSVYALRLPGVVSQGETEAEALCNIEEAFQGAIATYIDRQMPIPWADVAVDRPNGCKEQWIVVNV
jgi:predicted RNase H-like HicB family nuclease